MPTQIRCPACHERVAVPRNDSDDVVCPFCGAYVYENRDDRTGRRKASGMSTVWKVLIGLSIVGGLLSLLCCGGIYVAWHWMAAPTTFPEQTEDYAQARTKFKTNLIRMGSAPQPWEPQVVPNDAIEVEYTPGTLRCKAWVDRPEPNGARKPAVLFLHGGFAFGADDWEQAQPFRDAGFVVMVPMLRGENGLQGNYSMFYNEVDDALAAADVLAKQPNSTAAL